MSLEVQTSSVEAEQLASQDRDVTTLATGAGIVLIGKVGGRVVDAVAEIILARILGPSFYGLYAIGMTFLSIAGRIGTLGLHNGVIQFGTRYWKKSSVDLKRTLIYSIGLSCASGIFLGLVLFSLSPWLAHDVFNKDGLLIVFRIIAFTFPFAIGMWVASASTRISKRMKYSVLGEDITQPVTNILLIFILFFLGYRLVGALIASLVSFGVAFCLLIYFVLRLYPEIIGTSVGKNFRIRDLVVYSIPTGLAGTFTLITGWMSRLFIGYFRPASEAGIFQAASQVSFFFIIVLSSLSTIFAPMIADLYHRQEISRIEELYRINTKWGLYLITPFFLALCFIPQEFMIAIFGPAYVSGWIPLLLLATTQVVNVGTGAVGYILIMTGHQNDWFTISGIIMLLSAVLNFLLIPRYGMNGAAIASAISISLIYIVGLIRIRRSLAIWPYDRRYLKGVGAALVTALALFAVFWIFGNLSPLILVLLSAVISYVVFGIVLLLLGLDREDWQFIKVITQRLNINISLPE